MGWHIGSRDSRFGSINIGFLLEFTYVLLVPDSLISKPVWYLEWVQEKTRILRFQLCQVHLGEEGGLVQVKQCRFFPLPVFLAASTTASPGKVMGAPWEHWVCVGVAGSILRWDAPQESPDPPHKNLKMDSKKHNSQMTLKLHNLRTGMCHFPSPPPQYPFDGINALITSKALRENTQRTDWGLADTQNCLSITKALFWSTWGESGHKARSGCSLYRWALQGLAWATARTRNFRGRMEKEHRTCHKT